MAYDVLMKRYYVDDFGTTIKVDIYKPHTFLNFAIVILALFLVLFMHRNLQLLEIFTKLWILKQRCLVVINRVF